MGAKNLVSLKRTRHLTKSLHNTQLFGGKKMYGQTNILGIRSSTRSLYNIWKWVYHQKLTHFFIVSLQANIRNTFFNQKSQRHPEVRVLGLGRFSENITPPPQSGWRKPYQKKVLACMDIIYQKGGIRRFLIFVLIFQSNPIFIFTRPSP